MGFDIKTPVFGPGGAIGGSMPQIDEEDLGLKVRRSPRLASKASAGTPLFGLFSPRGFLRSPVDGLKANEFMAVANLSDNPIQIPPSLFTFDPGSVGDSSPVVPESSGLSGRKRDRSMHPDSGHGFDFEHGVFDDMGKHHDEDKNALLIPHGTALNALQISGMKDLPLFHPNPAPISVPRIPMSSSTGDSASGSSCHQCKSRRAHEHLVFCDTVSKRGKSKRSCRKKYCYSCLFKFYHESPPAAGEPYSCPSCRGICSCAACKRLKFKDHTSATGGNDRLQMSPATSVACGLVYFGDNLESNKKFRLDIPREVWDQARIAAQRVVENAAVHGIPIVRLNEKSKQDFEHGHSSGSEY